MKAKMLISTAAPALLAGFLMIGLSSSASSCQGQTGQNLGASALPAPPPGQVWVYPTGVFPDDFYALWLAINGAPYASGDLPFPYYSVPDNQPGTRPVFAGNALPNGKWTVVLKARRLETVGEGSYIEGDYTAFNLGLAAGARLTKFDPVPPVEYLLTTDSERFSSGFGELHLLRSIEVRGELIPGNQKRFFGYTPNFDPAASPDTNPAFDADWLPATYPRGSEFESGQGYGVWSTKSVIYGGFIGFDIFLMNADLSVSDCLLYGQYGNGILDRTGPNNLLVRNVDIIHTYCVHQLDAKNDVKMLTWAIGIQNVSGGGGKRAIQDCYFNQSPTWQEYYFMANPKQGKYVVGTFPGSYAVNVSHQSKQSPGDSVRIERSTMKNCGYEVIVYNTSDVDLLIANCVIDGGYFPVPLTKYSPYPDWHGTCIIIYEPTVDAWGSSPVIKIRNNDLVARGRIAWGVKLDGCGNGEVTIADNQITCASASPMGYAGGVGLAPSGGVGCNRNLITGNTIKGTGGWALSVDTLDVPCEGNLFLENDLSRFSAQEAGAVYFGPQANDNIFYGDPGAGIIDLGTGNVVEL